MLTEPYADQARRWPRFGRHVLARFDAESVTVYQAYSPAIGRFAAANGFFGGDFRYSRMSWVKPNFLWMMYRSGWGTKPDQEVTLAVRLKRPAFDALLAAAVPSTFVPELYSTEAEWQSAVRASDVRLQWDPDHHPSGAKLERRAVQLGLRGAALAGYGRDWLLGVEDISAFVAEQRANLAAGIGALLTPREEVYPVADGAVAARLGVSPWTP